MARQIIIRILQALVTIWGVASVAFLLLRLAPGDPARVVLGPRATPETLRHLRHQLGIDGSIAHQYVTYVGRLLHGDLGTSTTFTAPVTSIVGPRIVPSLLLVGFSLVIVCALTLPLAMWSARRRNRPVDHSIRALSTMTFAMPSFWLGLLLVYLLSLKLALFPAAGYGTGVAGVLRSLALPAVTLALATFPVFLRSLRSSMIDMLSSEFVNATRARGLSERRVIVRHVLRNSLTSTVTLLGFSAGVLLSFAVVIENVFGIPGLGSLLVSSIAARDYPVTQALVFILGTAVVVCSLLTDLAYVALDPRVRL